MSESSSFGSSSSTSTPSPPLPQDLSISDQLTAVANLASQYAQQLYSWGQNVFNQVTDITNQNIAAFTRASDMAIGGAQQSMDQFTGSFLPDYQNLRATAADYANTGRQARNAGEAESGMMQGMDVARENAERTLESQGIDTSSGRYADLELANQTKGIAAAVGAGQQSVRADEATALGLKKQALDYGLQLPGIATNFLNQANQARIAAQNSEIARANAGVNLNSLPNAYLATSMGNKFLPNRGQNTQSSSQQRGQSNNPGKNNSNQGQGGDRGGGGPGGGDVGKMYGANDKINPGIGNGVGGAFGGGGAGAHVIPGNGGGIWNGQQDPWNLDTSGGFGQFGGIGQQPYDPMSDMYGGYNTGIGTDWGGNDVNLSGMDPYGSYMDPYGSAYGMDYSQYDNMGQWNGDWGGGDTGWSGDNSGYTGWGGGSDSGYNSYGMDYSQAQPSYSDSYYDPGPSYTDYGVGSGGDYSFDAGGDYERGGAIPTTGGPVPRSASPSGGRQTDDIHASVNAGEFIIPRDVAQYKGKEFFHKLIASSRKNLASHGKPHQSGPVGGQPAPRPQGPVTFRSRPMGQ